MPAIFAFLINVAREVIKDIEDMEGDRKGKAMTLPVRYGTTPALWLASARWSCSSHRPLRAYQLKVYTVLYLYPVLFVDVLLRHGHGPDVERSEAIGYGPTQQRTQDLHACRTDCDISWVSLRILRL